MTDTTTEQFPAVISRIVGGEAIQTVNARDLHDFLQVGKDFSTWIKDRIDQYEFVQGQDFEVFPEIGGNPSGGRPAKEYAISIDMAKRGRPRLRSPNPTQQRNCVMNVREDNQIALILKAPVEGARLTMSSREIAELLGSRHDKVKQSIERLANRGTISSPPMGDFININGVTGKEYLVGERESYIVVAQLSPEFTAKLVDFWQKHRDAVNTAVVALPNFADPVAAARAWADEREARTIAERTKAEIGTRREATAMNTASQAVKRADRLEGELDRSRQYASIKRMSMLYHGQEFNWRLLKRASSEMGLPPTEVFDQNYGTVNAYHAAVWREAYALDIAGPQNG